MSAQIANQNRRENPYLVQQIRTASPEKLILMLYEIGLRSCRAGQREKAARVFVELISALDFDYKAVAMEYFDLYRYALDQVHSGQFQNAIMVLEGLREVWESAVMGRTTGNQN
ncbi:MAG: flagellar protein FliS [Caldithrix sp.]|nr:MAG: flagellar protein FliS [Caldithrix sp.]